MSRLTGKEAFGLMEAYRAVYAPRELTEEQVWEGVENWVNSLLEEGYDLSDYTWEEMYEAYNYINEQMSDVMPGGSLEDKLIGGTIAAGVAGLGALKDIVDRTAPVVQNIFNTKKLSPEEKIRRKDARKADRERLKNIKDKESTINLRSPTKPVETVKPSSSNSDGREELINRAAEKAAAQKAAAQKAAAEKAAAQKAAAEKAAAQKAAAQKAAAERAAAEKAAAKKAAAQKAAAEKAAAKKLLLPKQVPSAEKIDPLQTVKDIGKNIPGIRNILGQPARERAFGTTRTGQVVRGLGTAGAVGLDVRGNLSDPTGTTKSTTAQVGSLGPGTVGNVLRATGDFFGGDNPSGGSGLARGASETGKDLQRLGQRMLDQPKSRTQKSIPGL